MQTSEVVRRVRATPEICDLIPRCSWCKRIATEGEWFFVTLPASGASDWPGAPSHSICPECAANAA